MDDLFRLGIEDSPKKDAPLADRMRPRTLDEFEEQSAIVGRGTLLRRCIEEDNLQSVIFYGPPGTGKTTLALILARTTRARFVTLSAVMAGVSDLRRIIAEAREQRNKFKEKTLLFIDEIHRFNKAQQDALLPSVESGLITLVGSTTENPMFSINRPLLSRSRLYRFEPLSEEAVQRVIRRALQDKERGLGNYDVKVDPEAIEHIASTANGDARAALNYLEFAVLTAPFDGKKRVVNKAIAAEACQRRILSYDKADEHYDAVSAFIKSMRGSDPQATLYWLARLIYAGDPVEYIARRIMIHAAEDVGLADPQALVVATAAAQAVERIGLPEAQIVLAEAALYIALAPKSNSVVTGIYQAMEAVQNKRAGPAPVHLRDASYKGARVLGHGKGYLYPHDYPGHWVRQQYLPDDLKEAVFYKPSSEGAEKDIIIKK